MGDVEMMEAAAVNNSPPMDRLVHLDLKGAPPKMDYYEKLFPLLSRLGCTGLLLEYEDMFPYWGELDVLAAPNAYSSLDIMRLQKMAGSYGMKVVPLVQTFGHFEFVLKHKEFFSIREVPLYPMALCPLNRDSLKVVTTMLDQVVALHPGSEYFHIGADEVFHLGLCKNCATYMRESGLSPVSLFFQYVRKVLQHLKTERPNLKLIMWDDMFRKSPLSELIAASIGDIVEPMVWSYGATIELPEGMWETYAKVFSTVWAASAFKGASGPCQIATNAMLHIENHRSWLKLMRNVSPLFKNFRGYALTGWQRYDHYATLCELLPVSMPSLITCLVLINEGHFTEEVHKRASEELKFSELMPLNPFKCLINIPECDFPGCAIFTGIQRVLVLHERHKLLLKNDRLRGWMSDYHVTHRFCNPAHLKGFLPEAQELLEHMQTVEADLRQDMLDTFFPDAVDEWLAVNLAPKINEVNSLVTQAIEQIEIGACAKT